MKQHDIPVTLYQSKLIAKKVTGEDDVGIISVSETPWHYWYGGFERDDVLNFDNLREVSDVDAVIKATRWFDLPKLSLAEVDSNE